MAGAASALFLLDIKGHVLIWRDYRGDVSSAQAERFFTKHLEKEGDPQYQDPVVYDNGITYMFIQHNNVYLMIASRQNCNATSLLLFLHRLVDVFKHYFEVLEEESLRDNFVVVYELLDEIMDFGFPQFTEAKILSEFIKTDAYRMEVTQRPPMAVTNAVSWRSEGIRYKKNEVFLDVVESVNILVNSNGQIIRSDVVGALKMRTYLTGMPECKLGLNDRVLLEAQGRSAKGKAIDLDDIKFHQCVRLARFENDRTISFIPPESQKRSLVVISSVLLRSRLQIKLRGCEKLVELQERFWMQLLVSYGLVSRLMKLIGWSMMLLLLRVDIHLPSIIIFFPKSCCTSVNEVICHGIPDARKLEDGDIVNVDISVYYNGVHADLNDTYFVGNVDEESRRLVQCTYECLEKAIAIVKPGVRFREVGEVINRHATMAGFSVVKSYCGHGIGELFHCAPNIPHYARNKAVGVMKAGQTFTIEPMINAGVWRDRMWPDGWTAVTADGKRSAQFEHTLLVTETGVEVLTARLPSSPKVYPWLEV